MDKILEALKKLLPASDVTEVAAAVESYLEDAKAEMNAEYTTKLNAGYKELAAELAEAEKVAEKGYDEAAGTIETLRNQIATMREEYEAAREELCEQAYQKLLDERAAKEQEVKEMYDQYDGKLLEMKQYIVGKVHQFLRSKGTEIYEQARKDLLADPRLAEGRVALDRIVNITADFLDVDGNTAGRLEEAQKTIDDLKAQLKLTERRYVHADMEAKKAIKEHKAAQAKLTEAVTHTASNEKKERVAAAKNVTGRGRIVETAEVEVIKEHQTKPATTTDSQATPLTEASLGLDFNALRSLSGVAKK